MPSLSDVVADSAKLNVSFPGGDLHITYRPSKFTRAIFDDPRDVTDVLCDLLIDWDLTRPAVGKNGKGPRKEEPIPCTPEAMKEVPMTVVRAVYRAIILGAGEEEVGEDEQTSKGG